MKRLALYTSLLLLASAGAWAITTSKDITITITGGVTCTVNVTGNASIQNGINSAGSGGTVCLHGTFTGQTFNTLNNITLRGDGASSTILDGGGMNAEATDGFNDQTTGVTIDSITVRNYGGNKQLATWNGWTVRNSTFSGAVENGPGTYGIGLYLYGGGVTIQNNLITNNFDDGIEGVLDQPGTDTTKPSSVIGNEISFNNPTNILDGNAAGLKILWHPNPTGATLNVLNNYVHDNHGPALWCDGEAPNWTIQGNTLINNTDNGIMFETCLGADISHNVVNGSGGIAIFVSSSGTDPSTNQGVNVHDNNVTVSNGGSGIVYHIDPRVDGCGQTTSPPFYLCTNVTIQNNTETFLQSGGEHGFGNYAGVSNSSTNLSNNNNFHVVNTGDAHFNWELSGNCCQSTQIPFSTYRSNTGEDAGSTINTTPATVGGCTQIGCSGSGW